ncbi:MAG: hypothetical protein PW734_01705 [Verrucomicrobium sp.]|nr:hypothetical protein [Verrucomicrobium sp.]
MPEIQRHSLHNSGYGTSGKSVSVQTPDGEAAPVAFKGFRLPELWLHGPINYHNEVSKIVTLREKGPDQARTVVTTTTRDHGEKGKYRTRSTESAEEIVKALADAGFKRPPVREQTRLGALAEKVRQRFER